MPRMTNAFKASRILVMASARSQNRDIIKLFESLRVSDSFLMKTNMRELIFRKPAYLAGL